MFGLIYFVQGLAEPSEGLVAQPVRALLNRWMHTPGEIASFMAIVSLPWMIKPLYGLIVDFVPFFQFSRRNYLLTATAATATGLIWLGIADTADGQSGRLLVLLIVPTIGIAFSDVVIDAFMIEKGQPLGLTGRLQSIQWGSMYGATVLAGSLGGWLSQTHRQDLAFLICGTGAAVSFLVTWIWIRDSAPVPISDDGLTRTTFRSHIAIMKATLLDRQFQLTAAFLVLWNFNPFSSTIQQLHFTTHCGMDEQQYGHSVSLFSLASIAACLFYGFVCRLIPLRWLLHAAVLAGVLSTLVYLRVSDARGAYAASLASGFAYMLGNLIQMDIAARICPAAIAASFFALLMSVSNISISASTGVGGWLYERWSSTESPNAAYVLLVYLGAATTAACWALTPWIRGTSIIAQSENPAQEIQQRES